VETLLLGTHTVPLAAATTPGETGGADVGGGLPTSAANAVCTPRPRSNAKCPFVSLAAVDGLRDEGVEYASRLNQADVPTELHLYSGAPHGFQMFAGTTLADRANRDLDEWLRAVLELD
jgi:acetyl esterase/lipase